MIQFEDVTKSYDGKEVVKSISFNIPRHHTFVLLGKSGSGKTTTLKMINRLIDSDSGVIKINDQDISNVPAYKLRRNIGYVIQNTGLFPHMSIYENIATVPKLLGWEKSKIDTRIRDLMEVIGLELSYLEQTPDELSGGQQQRVGLARALAADPDILLMDEPFAALDLITKADILYFFLSLEEVKQKTIVMVTHDIMEAFKLGDQICLLDDGNIEQIGTPKELLLSPESESVSTFFNPLRTELEMEVFTFQDIYVYLNQFQFPFNSYPFPPNLGIGAVIKNLESLSAPNDEIEKVYKSLLKLKSANNTVQ